MSGLGSRTTETGQRIRDFLAKARKEHYWNEAHVAMYDLNELEDRCVRAEEALRQAERLITEHHKVGALDGYHIGDTCPVCAAFDTPLAAVPEEDKGV